MLSWDHQILSFAATHRTVGLDYCFRGITWLGSLYVLIPLTALISLALAYFQKRWEIGLLLLGLGGASLLAHGAKLAWGRPRPALHQALVSLPTDSSFPSAHTAQIAGFALSIALLSQHIWPESAIPAWLLAGGLIMAVGASRIYLQVHYPSDVLGGLILAILWVALAQKLL